MTLEVLREPLFGIALTVGAYAAAQSLHRRFERLHPFVAATGILLAILLPLPGALEDKLKAYKAGGDIIAFLLGPATVALAVPLYKNARHIRGHILPILQAIAAGGAAAMLTGAGTAVLLGCGAEVARAMLPKSVTTPIAISLVAQFQGTADVARLQSLSAALVVATGLFGALTGPLFLKAVGIRRQVPLGLAMGTAAHGIGTATALRRSDLQGAASGLAMALNGVFTSVLMIPLYWLLR